MLEMKAFVIFFVLVAIVSTHPLDKSESSEETTELDDPVMTVLPSSAANESKEELYVSKQFYVHTAPDDVVPNSQSFDLATTQRPFYKVFFITLPTPFESALPTKAPKKEKSDDTVFVVFNKGKKQGDDAQNTTSDSENVNSDDSYSTKDFASRQEDLPLEE